METKLLEANLETDGQASLVNDFVAATVVESRFDTSSAEIIVVVDYIVDTHGEGSVFAELIRNGGTEDTVEILLGVISVHKANQSGDIKGRTDDVQGEAVTDRSGVSGDTGIGSLVVVIGVDAGLEEGVDVGTDVELGGVIGGLMVTILDGTPVIEVVKLPSPQLLLF
jgi:hypothetical protein